MLIDSVRIHIMRKRIGWTQKQMAKALGISDPNTISHWETGYRVPTGTTAHFLLLLERLRGKDLQRITKYLEKLGSEKSDV